MHGSVWRAIGWALVAGAIAITVNILVLELFDGLGIVTARGGLQRLVRLWLTPPIVRSGLGDAWLALGLPHPDSALFRTGFKVAVGLAMAVFYALAVEPWMPGRVLAKGLAYALFAWLLNALVVLPLLGEGVAGARLLTALGMTCFAIAHTIFFVILAGLYGRLRR
jgi:hypothetical protein